MPKITSLVAISLTAFLALTALASNAANAVEVETKEPIKLMYTNTSDSDFISYVFGEILEDVGYNVEYVNIDYFAHFAAVETGDLHLSTGAWDSTGWTTLNDLTSRGKVENYGSTGVEIQEGWWYPAYIKEACPELPSWTALKSEKCAASFATAETAPAGRFVDAPSDWGTGARELAESLGLNIEVISAGSAVALIATIKTSVEAGEPVIGYGYTPHWFIDSVDGGFIDFEQDYAGTGYVWKMGNKELMSQVPIASRLLHLYTLPTSAVASAMDRIDNDGESIKAVAREWVEKNRSTWQAWLR